KKDRILQFRLALLSGRRSQSQNKEAWLYTMATAELTLYAERLADDLPEDYKILHAQSDTWSFPSTKSLPASPTFMQKKYPKNP
ncbi:MAG: hypothetical protein ACOH2G_14770, partial [Ewingella sp.]